MNDESLGITALVCGLISIFIFPILFGGVAIALGATIMRRNEAESRAYTNARIGLIAGCVGIALWVVTLISLYILGIDTSSLFNATNTAPSSAF